MEETVDVSPAEEIETCGTTARKPSKIVHYLRELSVVVIGVAITFLASGWITNHREKKELRAHLEAVKAELETNLATVNSNLHYYDKLVELSYFLQGGEYGDFTLARIMEASRMDNGQSVMHRMYYYMPVESSSYEALKQSGTAKHIRDGELWRNIMESYKSLEELKHENDTYMYVKLNYFYTSIRENKGDVAGNDIDRYNFYRSTYTFRDAFKRTLEKIERSLSRL